MKIKYENIETGEIVNQIDLLSTQEKFFLSRSKFPLYSGGFGCGKSTILVLKVIQHLTYPNNYGLLGRLKYRELQDTTQQEFFKWCPQNYIRSYSKSQERLYLKNGSQLIFRHLDNIAENEIKSLNLGFFAIDQVEEIPENVFLGLRGRLRRVIEHGNLPPYVHQGMMSCNPKLFWAFKLYRQQNDPDYELFESSTLENKENLPPSYIENLLSYPESWKRQFVYGIWDESLLSDRAYFPVEYIQEQAQRSIKKIRDFEGFTIYREVDFDDDYQIGIDPSEGVVDPSAIVVASMRDSQVVATWQGMIQPDMLADKVAQIGRIYNNAKLVPEVNSMGIATLVKLKQIYEGAIYKREVFDTIQKKKIEKLGWKTSYANKVLLFDNLLKLLRENKVRINDQRIIDEMKTFVWSDESKASGLGATEGYHDDMIMATALAFWGLDGKFQDKMKYTEPPKNSILGTLREIQNKNSKQFIKKS